MSNSRWCLKQWESIWSLQKWWQRCRFVFWCMLQRGPDFHVAEIRCWTRWRVLLELAWGAIFGLHFVVFDAFGFLQWVFLYCVWTRGEVRPVGTTSVTETRRKAVLFCSGVDSSGFFEVEGPIGLRRERYLPARCVLINAHRCWGLFGA